MPRGQIVEKGPGKFLIRTYIGRVGGKKKVVSKLIRGSRKDAEMALAKNTVAKDEGRLLLRSKHTVATMRAIWLSSISVKRPRTAHAYAQRSAVIVTDLGHIRIQDLTWQHISSFYASLLSERNHGPRTVLFTHAVLRLILKYAQGMGLIQTNPCDHPNLKEARPKAPLPGAAARALTPEEARRLLKLSQGSTLYPLWRLLLTTGLRPQEALALHWEDLQGEVLSIRRVLEPNGSFCADMKNEGSKRALVLDEDTRETLMVLWASQGMQPGLMFRTASGRPLDMSNVRKLFKAALQKAGLPTSVRLYDTRHTHFTNLLHEKVDVKTLAARGGWSNPNVFLSTYAHAAPGAVVAGVVGNLYQEE